MARKPAVSGAFYPASASEVKQFISSALSSAKVDDNIASSAVSFVAPHAGYIYSGKVAAYTYKALAIAAKSMNFDSFVVIGPNHTGYGTPISLSYEDWETPLGIVKNDRELTAEIAKSDYIEIDETAHAYEHSVEVQLPFLQSVVEKPRCVFICMGDQSDAAIELLSSAIIEAAGRIGRRIAIIASSDFNHYESAAIAKGKDMPAIEALISMDRKKFNELLRKSDDTACGHGPISVAEAFAEQSNARKGYLLKYANSGDTTGDYSSVVAYASIIFSKG